ncbi:recombinase family protein [Bacillus cereus]|nr:recombinase family protein [Bacillus cereus]
MKCVIYARVSTKREEQKNSLQNQISYANDLASQHGFTVIGTYIDNGISGGTIDNRGEIQRLLEDAKDKKFNVLISKSVSRLGRNTIESLQLADKIERLGIRLILPEDLYDSKKNDSRLSFNLKAVLAEEESVKLSQRTKIGHQAKAKQGFYKASLPAYGYKRDKDKKKLVLDEVYAPIVRKIFDLYLYEDWGMFRIGNYLMEQGIKTPRAVSGGSNSGSRWHQSTIKTILTNPIYTGALVQHREETTKFYAESKDGKKKNYKERVQVDPEKQIIIQNNHPAIITQEEFDTVQEKRKKKGSNKSNGQESLFAHIAKCADCQMGMTFRKDRRKGAYVCCGYVKHTSSYCSSHIIEQNVLLQAVKDDIRTLIKSNVKIEKLYGLAAKRVNTQQSKHEKELKAIEQEIINLDNRFKTLLDLLKDGIIDKEQFKEQNSVILSEKNALSNRRMTLSTQLETKKDMEQKFHTFKRQVERFANLDIDDETVLKQVLQSLISKIDVFEGGTIKIHYNIATPTMIAI